MAKEDIVFSAKIDSADGAKSLAELKKEFKEIQAELSGAVKGTEAYRQSLSKLANVKDEIEDLNDEIKGFQGAGKFQAFSNVASSLAGGFQAATGAAALFGIQSKEVEESLLKIQAAMALTDGLKALEGMKDSLMVVGNVIKTHVVTAFSTLKGAIAATGIGALIVAIGVLIYKVDEYNDAIEEEYDKQRKLNEELKKTTDEYLKQAVASEKLRDARKGGLNELERELKLLEASGASADKIAAKKQDILDKEIFNLKVRRSTIEGDAAMEAELTQQILDKEAEKQAILLANQKRLRDEAQKRRDEAKRLADQQVKDEQEKYDAMLKAQEKFEEEERSRAEAARQIKFDEELLTGEKVEEAKIINTENLQVLDETFKNLDKEKATAFRQGEIAEDIDNWNKRLDIARDAIGSIEAVSDAFFTARLANAKKGSAEEERIAENQFNVRKAMMLALAAIDGGKAITASLAASPVAIGPIPNPAGITSLAFAISTTAAQLIKIGAMKFKGGTPTISSPSSPSTGTTPNIQTSAPNVTNSTTQLSEEGKNLTVKAELVETQATSTQKRVSRLQNQASFP